MSAGVNVLAVDFISKASDHGQYHHLNAARLLHAANQRPLPVGSSLALGSSLRSLQRLASTQADLPPPALPTDARFQRIVLRASCLTGVAPLILNCTPCTPLDLRL
jgi:hypothetical protein